MVVLDTNVIIEHLRQHGKNSPLISLGKHFPDEPFAISVINIQELFEGKSTRIVKEMQYLLETLKPLEILSYTYDIARLAGEIARDIESKIDLADAAIAATTIINNAKLATLNKKDFQRIKNLEFV